VFAALAAAWRAAGAPERGWLAPCVRTAAGPRYGHPIVLGRGLAATLAEAPADAPLWSLRAAARPLFSAAVESLSVLDDLDGPDDLARLRAKLAP
jgi:CTP:molybdopterin cytidylyltransferase MocA